MVAIYCDISEINGKHRNRSLPSVFLFRFQSLSMLFTANMAKVRIRLQLEFLEPSICLVDICAINSFLHYWLMTKHNLVSIILYKVHKQNNSQTFCHVPYNFLNKNSEAETFCPISLNYCHLLDLEMANLLFREMCMEVRLSRRKREG